ncbi:MAG: M56 family metallopeptidase [Candidatus Pristimantibacillus sp.]
MTSFFTTLVNMGITASYVALAVMLIRILFKRLPAVFSYALWAAVLIRLVFPVTIGSSFSLMQFLHPNAQSSTSTMEYIPYNLGLNSPPAMDTGLNQLNQIINSSLPPATPLASANPMQVIMEISSYIWVIGMAVLLIYSLVSYLKVRNKVKTATLVAQNIYETDRIATPFVFGLIKPTIYIPTGISEEELSYIRAHEQTHIHRFDYLIKPFAFLLVIIHWFNPIMWLSFALMSKDMEMSCDETVVRTMGKDIKVNYAHSLLALSVHNSGLRPGSPLAFGESHIKSRIKNILAYKKPALWMSTTAIAVTALLLVVLTTNPASTQADQSAARSSIDTQTLMDHKTPYVGNASKVITLVDTIPLPSGVVRDTVELHTATQPYGLTIHIPMSDDPNVIEGEVINEDDFISHSLLLFSLITNVDVITYNITDPNGARDAASYTYTREMAEQWIGEDVRVYSENKDTLIRLIDLSTQVQIEQYLETIMSSPATSSNPGDYIKAHPKEYERILNMREDALPYLLTQLENDNGLRGRIIELAINEIR